MNITKLEFKFFLLFKHASIFTITVISTFIIEIILLQLKYSVFTGGFLQKLPIIGIKNIIYFSALFFLINSAFYSFIVMCWIKITSYMNLRNATSAYCLFWFIITPNILIISAKYKLQSYFGDFLTFSVLKNLGGGSIIDAILFAINDASIIIAIIIIILILFFFSLYKISTSSLHIEKVNDVKFKYIVCNLFILFFLIHISRYNEIFYKNFLHTISFSCIYKISSIFYKNEEYMLNNIVIDGTTDNNEKQTKKYYYSSSAKKNIILIVLESARFDALYKRINNLEVTPNLNNIATNGTYSSQYYSHSGFTTSSILSIFTGSVVFKNSDPFLLKTLKNAGYKIVTISGQDETFGGIAANSGTRDLSDEYFDASLCPEKRAYYSASPGSLVVPNEEVVNRFISTANNTNWSIPTFFYINIQSGHFPYFYEGMKLLVTDSPINRNSIKRENIIKVQEIYYNAIANADYSVGIIIDLLKRKKIFDNSLVVIVGDHGESIYNDGFLGHGFYISHEQMRTIFVSNVKDAIENHPTGHADLADILLRLSGANVDIENEEYSNHPLFHYTGDPNHPDSIGHSYADGRLVVINASDLSLQIVTHGHAKQYNRSEIESNPELKKDFYALVHDWQRKSKIK